MECLLLLILKGLGTDNKKVILTQTLAEIKSLWVIINEDCLLSESCFLLKHNRI